MLTDGKWGFFRVLKREPRMIAREVFVPASLAGAYAAIVVVWHNAVGFVPELPISVVTVVGTAMAILLGFRTSAAYDRWWEARTIWGAIGNDSRTLTRQAVTLLGSDGGDVAKRIVHRQIAWCYGLRSMLLEEQLSESTAALIREDELVRARQWRSIPNALLAEQAADVSNAPLAPMRFVQIDRTLRRLTDHLGKCERINNTPFPFQYDAMVSQIIGLFALLLPFALVAQLNYMTIPMTIVLVAVFRTISGVARVLQDPFSGSISDTPMLSLCRTVEVDLRQQLRETSTPPLIVPTSGVLP